MNLNQSKIEEARQVGLRSHRQDVGAIGSEIQIRSEVGSTNDVVSELASSGAKHGLAVFAEHQTAGRGRKGNVWEAARGQNLTFSVLLRPEFEMSKWTRISHTTALAVVWAIEPWLPGMKVELKWPNDVYVDGRKVCGILVESKSTSSGSFVTVGIGLNVNAVVEDFPPELRHTAVSLRTLCGGRLQDRNELAGTLLAELNCAFGQTGDGFASMLAEIERRSMILRKTVRFRVGDNWEVALVTGFGENGEMLVRDVESKSPEKAILNADEVRLV